MKKQTVAAKGAGKTLIKPVFFVVLALFGLFFMSCEDPNKLPPGYSVTFEANGGDPAPQSQTIVRGGTVTEPQAMIKANHGFGGWYKESVFTNRWDFASDTIMKDTILYAKWNLNRYTVTFNANGGSPAPDQKTVDLNTIIDAPPVMTRENHIFDGWYKESTFENQWDFASDTITADTILHAKWNLSRYTVTFDANGGDPAPAQETVDHNTAINAPPEMTKTNFVFDGWYQESSFRTKWDFATDTVTENITLYAKWSIKRYTVTFDADGGTPVPQVQSVAVGSRVSDPGNSMRKVKFGFDGWFKEDTLTNQWNFTKDTVTADITLYAKWIPAYSLTIAVASGQDTFGSVQIVTGNAAENITGTSVTVQAAANAGYTFEKWAGDAAGTTEVSVIPSYTFNIGADTTLYAVFKVLASKSISRTIKGVDVGFRYVPEGSFQRNATTTNISEITYSYWMAETETTQKLFQAVMGKNPSSFNGNIGKEAVAGETQEKRPVEQVGWWAAITFCNKLSIADGKDPVYSVKVNGLEVDWENIAYVDIPGTSDSVPNADWNAATADLTRNGYRLPTEMEWWWAAMGADKTDQPNTTGWNKAFAGKDSSNSIGDYVWYKDNSGSKTHEVGKKLPNELGLYDMSGNVNEWCWDNNGAYPDGTLTDYIGKNTSPGNRMMRGGNYSHTTTNIILTWRDYGSGYTRRDYLGLRVVSGPKP